MKTKTNTCPCIEDCLCKPICRNKNYTQLMRCILVYQYVFKRPYRSDELYSQRMRTIFAALRVESISHLGYELKY